MPKKFPPMIFVLFLLIVIFAWSPWLSNTSAKGRTEDFFTHAWEFVADGCGLNCQGCGAISSQRVPFGMLVTIDYACGMIPADLPEYHRQATAFVSPLGAVHGLPTP